MARNKIGIDNQAKAPGTFYRLVRLDLIGYWKDRGMALCGKTDFAHGGTQGFEFNDAKGMYLNRRGDMTIMKTDAKGREAVVEEKHNAAVAQAKKTRKEFLKGTRPSVAGEANADPNIRAARAPSSVRSYARQENLARAKQTTKKSVSMNTGK